MAATARRVQNPRSSAAVDDEPPLFAGRMLTAVALIAAMWIIPMSKLGDLVEIKQDTTPVSDAAQWVPGSTGRVQITLITADYNLLMCASDQTVDGNHCAYKSETEMWPRKPGAPIDENKRDIIQPYRTWPDNRLILVAGLWADPAVALRLHREPPSGVPQKRLSRFIADCQMKFLGSLNSPKLRWPSSSQWLTEGSAMVAEPISCTIRTTED